jgi:hypothetical protein
MRRNHTTYCASTPPTVHSNSDVVSLFNSQNIPRSLIGTEDVTINQSPNEETLTVAISDSKTNLLNGIINTNTWIADSVSPQLPYAVEPLVPLTSGTTVRINLSDSVLTLIPSTSTPIGYQWFVTNNSTTNVVVSATSGVTTYGSTLIAPLQGAWVRLVAIDVYLLLTTPENIDTTLLANLTDVLEGTSLLTISDSDTEIMPNMHSGGTTIVIAEGTTGCRIVLHANAATVGLLWYIANGTTNSIQITKDVACTVLGKTTINKKSASIVRQYATDKFMIIGAADDLDLIRSTVFNDSAPTNQGILDLPNDAAPMGSTTTMDGPNGEVRLHALSEQAATGAEWTVVNATTNVIPVKCVTWDNDTTPAPSLHGATFIPMGRVAIIRRYTATGFLVILSHPEDASPQSFNYFTKHTYNPGSTTVIHVPRHPTLGGPVLKNNTLVTVTAPNTMVYIWKEYLLPVGGYIFQFQNNSSTLLTFERPGSTAGREPGVAGFTGAMIIPDTSLITCGSGAAFVFVVDPATLDMAVYYDMAPRVLPPFVRAGSGFVAMATINKVRLGPTTSTNFVVPAGSACERALYIHNPTTGVATIEAESGVTVTGTLSIASGRTAYVRNTGNTTWVVERPIIHIPSASQQDDTVPNGCYIDITEPLSEIRVYAGDTRTIGFKWHLVNNSGTDALIKPTISGLGHAAPVIGNGDANAVVIVPSNRIAILIQVSSVRYSILVNTVYRRTQNVSTNNAVLDGLHQDTVVVLKMDVSVDPYVIVLNTTNGLSDGATIEICNNSDKSVLVTAPTSVILSRLNKLLIPKGSTIMVRFVLSTGFLLIGNLV